MLFLSEGRRDMKESTRRHLLQHGYEIPREPPRSEDGETSYTEWFDTRVLGLDSEDYRREFWREVHATGHTIGHVPRTLGTLLRELHALPGSDTCGILLAIALLQGATYPFWVLGRYFAREAARLRRRTYYDRERERRWRLADERVAIRLRRTLNPCPSVDQLRAAWARVQSTRGREHVDAVLRCGSLLEDLEGYVDNHAYTRRGHPGIFGRAPGIKGFLREKAPDLYFIYKSVMRCKALAKRYRQATGCPDPVPVEAVLPVNAASPSPGGMTFPVFPCLRDASALAAWMRDHGNTTYLRTQSWVRNPDGVYTEANLLPDGAQQAATEILTFGNGTLVALEAAIALRIAPECVGLDDGVHPLTRLGGQKVPRVPQRVLAWLRGDFGRRARGDTPSAA